MFARIVKTLTHFYTRKKNFPELQKVAKRTFPITHNSQGGGSLCGLVEHTGIILIYLSLTLRFFIFGKQSRRTELERWFTVNKKWW